MQFAQYDRSMAAEVAELIHTQFAQHRKLFPLNLIRYPAPFASVEEMKEKLQGESVAGDASFVAVDGARVVSAAIVSEERGTTGWWRVATDAEYRRRGLASECMRRGEEALSASGMETLPTSEVVDSRWEAASALLGSLGYELVDPDERNITMVVQAWEPRPPVVCEGYEIGTLDDEAIPEWMDVRNEIFGGDWEPGRFTEYFGGRPDYDPLGWFVARHEGRIVGMAGGLSICLDRAPEALRGGQIEYVGVLEGHRGTGLGEALMVACMNYLAEREALPALLLTQPFRVPAVRLYEKLGFRTLGAWQRWSKELN